MTGARGLVAPALLAACVATSAHAQTAPARAVPLAPTPDQVAALLLWESGRVCRDLIDACIDEDGNDIGPPLEFRALDLECRPKPDRRAACAFVSERYIAGDSRMLARERCTATLERQEDIYGNPAWRIVSTPGWYTTPRSRRRGNPVLLSCN